jgi:hypothetical protein
VSYQLLYSEALSIYGGIGRAFGLSVVSKIVDVLTSVDGSLLPIAVAIGGGVVLVRWAYDMYQQT